MPFTKNESNVWFSHILIDNFRNPTGDQNGKSIIKCIILGVCYTEGVGFFLWHRVTNLTFSGYHTFNFLFSSSDFQTQNK